MTFIDRYPVVILSPDTYLNVFFSYLCIVQYLRNNKDFLCYYSLLTFVPSQKILLLSLATHSTPTSLQIMTLFSDISGVPCN